MIVGGQDRGYDFSLLAKRLLTSKVKTVILLPDSGYVIGKEIERAGVEMFDCGAELGDRSAIRARAAIGDVRILRIGDDADLESGRARSAADERRDRDAEGKLTQESTAGQRRSHGPD